MWRWTRSAFGMAGKLALAYGELTQAMAGRAEAGSATRPL